MPSCVNCIETSYPFICLACYDQCSTFSKCLTYEGKQVPIDIIKFVCQLYQNDYDKAWEILSSNGVVKTCHYLCDTLAGTDIILMHNHNIL